MAFEQILNACISCYESTQNSAHRDKEEHI